MRETGPRCCSIWNPHYDKKTSEIHQIGILVIWPAQDKTNWETGLSGIHIHVAFFSCCPDPIQRGIFPWNSLLTPKLTAFTWKILKRKPNCDFQFRILPISILLFMGISLIQPPGTTSYSSQFLSWLLGMHSFWLITCKWRLLNKFLVSINNSNTVSYPQFNF